VQRILAELPESLDETYERILHEIPKSNRVHAHRLLQCVTVAVRPLHVEELAEVLAVEFDTMAGTPKLNENLRWEDQEQAVLSACSSLIAVVDNNGSRVVQFAHFSVKEFLTSDRLATSTIDASRYHYVHLELAHTIMAQACLSVLLHLDSHIDDEASIKNNFPLAEYAAANFGDHAEFEGVLSQLRDGVDHLLDADKPHFAAWMWVRRMSPSSWVRWEPEVPPLYYVAQFGFRGMVDYLISKRPEDQSARGYYGIPLHAALHRRHADVALLLLENCVDVDVRGARNETPLHFAVDGRLVEVTQILLECHADTEARDSSGRTPLHRSTDDQFGVFDHARFGLAWLLLERGADVDARDNNHSTPLHKASYWGCVHIAQLLLKHGANINARNNEDLTPLHRVLDGLEDHMPSYFFDTIQILLAHGADVDSFDNTHSTPLHVASAWGCVEAVRLLLEHGASVHHQDNFGLTPLQVASTEGHKEIERLISEHLESAEASEKV
jgi:ankyrin repeat protein